MASEYKRWIRRGWAEAQNVAWRLLHDALPALCSFCGQGLLATQQRTGLCQACTQSTDQLRLRLEERCAICADRLPCPNCPQSHFFFHQTVAALPYEGAIREHILHFKFGNRQDLARALAAHLASQWHTKVHQAGLPSADALIPIPLAPERLAERGFNQSWVLAQALRSALLHGGLAAPPLRQWLWRHTATAHSKVHLSSLGRDDRRLLTRDSFRAAPNVQGKRIYLLDDVMTTGATMNAAAQALHEQGAKEILCIALARA